MYAKADPLGKTHCGLLTSAYDAAILEFQDCNGDLSNVEDDDSEKIGSFTFDVVYITGSENIVTDALSRIYSNDSDGTE